jgi:squalene-hopene/tetraprenyl-beta-curcumene cyclase
LKPLARNPRSVGIRELFTVAPERERHFNVNPTGSRLGDAFLTLDRVLRALEPLAPKPVRRRAIGRAIDWSTERLNGEDGLGGIFPAMANLVMAYDALGYSKKHPDVKTARRAIDKLLVLGGASAAGADAAPEAEAEAADPADDGAEGYCQPCLSPVWDTGLALHSVMEAGVDRNDRRIAQASRWLRDRQILESVGDWAERRPGLAPGGWAFQYENPHYPDVDDTAVVVMALHRADPEANREAIDRATEWILGMQSRNGGWGAFDADNTHYYLNHIPFADHGALLDPPTADVTARCLGMLAQLGYERDHPAVASAIDYLKREQEADGSWFGRWGMNYIYGTWSVLSALNAAGEDPQSPYIRKAVTWLKARQCADGGWGEDGASYWPERRGECKASTPSQTAWAVLALMAAGEVDSESVSRGIAFLQRHPRDGARWEEPWFNAPGFPRVFYLRYHGYSAYFPLWALARYRRLIDKNDRRVEWGI